VESVTAATARTHPAGSRTRYAGLDILHSVPLQQPPEPPDPNTRIYVLVVVCEAVTIAGLWALGRVFL
jgi:hypothetical protein